MYIWKFWQIRQIQGFTLPHTAKSNAPVYTIEKRTEAFGTVVVVERKKEGATSSLLYIGQFWKGNETQIQGTESFNTVDVVERKREDATSLLSSL